jgi:hypothetical protein
MTSDFEHLDEDLTIPELGEQLGRGFAEADLSTFEALLLGAADALLQEMAVARQSGCESALPRLKCSPRYDCCLI